MSSGVFLYHKNRQLKLNFNLLIHCRACLQLWSKRKQKIHSQDLRETAEEEDSKKSIVWTCVADLFENAILYGSVKNVNSGRYTHYLALCTQENHIVWEGPAVRWGRRTTSNLTVFNMQGDWFISGSTLTCNCVANNINSKFCCSFKIFQYSCMAVIICLCTPFLSYGCSVILKHVL